MKLADAYVEIGARTGKLNKGLAGVRARLGRLGAGMRSLARTGALMFAGLAVAVGLVTKIFAEQEEAEAKLEAVLRATGHAAGFSANQLKKQATELQKMTGIGDEVIMSTQAILATFKQINGARFDRATKAILDMNTVLGTGPDSLRTMAIQVGKALNDPLLGLTALRRSGVSFTEEQKTLIKTLVETGQQAKAQAMILEELENEFGGAAKAVGDTFGGQLKKLKADLGDAMEGIGEMISELVKLGGGLDNLREKIRGIPDDIRNFIDIFVLGSLDMRKKWVTFTEELAVLWTGTMGLMKRQFGLFSLEGVSVMGKIKLSILDMQVAFSSVIAFIIEKWNTVRNAIAPVLGVMGLFVKRIELSKETTEKWSKAFSDSTNEIKKEIASISPEYAKLIEINDERIAQIRANAEKERNTFDSLRKEYLEGMTERKLKALETDKDIIDSSNMTQEAITKKQKDENKERGAQFFGLADIWKRAMEAALGTEPFKDVGLGVAGKASPGVRATEADKTSKDILSENKKGTDKLDSIDKQLKDGITVTLPEAQMS